MLKTTKKPTRKTAPKMIAVIKNGMTEREMDESEEAWANHQGPYMTLAEVLAIEKAKQAKSLNGPGAGPNTDFIV
ncbi:hypothetical protein [Spirosoma utsteinense]|uniref:Uncharacterized protein n=1 Tax=Spirosoma utsteinense TaxID=2585773 RepID=A0ABR6WFA0_9BACT|nr:hypothetical protein [Spirosoma utsteinense]MBC3789318.1 hypothetical protein [Spirosoma utsteinense]MBC3795225.1 hypothetical protein [Spirosoma utsteinense]